MAAGRKKGVKNLQDDKEERLRIAGALYKHLEQGYSLDCFEELSGKAIESALNLYIEEFCREKVAQAQRKGRTFWERVGRQQALGECLGNSRSWYYNMANRYGWRERVDVATESKGTLEVSIISYASPADKAPASPADKAPASPIDK